MDLVAMKVVAMGFLLNGSSDNGIPMNGTSCFGILVEWDLLLWKDEKCERYSSVVI